MIDFVEACGLAKKYYKDKLAITGLAKALDGGDKWFFSGGSPDEVRVGNVVIAISKADGAIETVTLPSKENFALLKSANPIDLPVEY